MGHGSPRRAARDGVERRERGRLGEGKRAELKQERKARQLIEGDQAKK